MGKFSRDESVTRQVVTKAVFRSDVNSYRTGTPIDTADYTGIYFIFSLPYYSSGIFAFRIMHSDDENGLYTEVEEDKLIYGRDTGLMPEIDKLQPDGSLLPREGAVGTKRWVRLDIDPYDTPGGYVSVLAVLTAERLATSSNAVYST